MAKRKADPSRLTSWKEIANFLGQPIATAQRWAKLMPVAREGRYAVVVPEIKCVAGS
jgi:hypothetical protein